jgi:quinol monooxygenase YgiN
MTTISTEKNLVTLINVFTVAPENQQRLIDLLVEATQGTMRNQPGYISANIHKSLDGTRVTNYAQWRSQADFEAHQTPCDPFLSQEALPVGDLLTLLVTRSQNQERLIPYALAGADRLLKSAAKK